MANYFEQACPLCDTVAEYCWVDADNVKYFDCPLCGMFQISRRAEELLFSELPQRKPVYSAQVKVTPEDHLLFIQTPSHEFRQQSDDCLKAEYTLKAALCLTCR